MIRIDDTLLEEIGLISLPKTERDQLLRQIYETLEMRVGMRLAERMTDQQLDEFERFIDTNDEAGALKWLESNFPDYKQVVADELEKLKGEIKKDAPKIMETMQQAAQISPQNSVASPGVGVSTQQPQQFQQPVPAPMQPAPAAPSADQPLPPLPQNPASFSHAPNPAPVQQQSQAPQPNTGFSPAQPVQSDDAGQPQQDGGMIPPPPSF